MGRPPLEQLIWVHPISILLRSRLMRYLNTQSIGIFANVQ